MQEKENFRTTKYYDAEKVFEHYLVFILTKIKG